MARREAMRYARIRKAKHKQNIAATTTRMRRTNENDDAIVWPEWERGMAAGENC